MHAPISIKDIAAGIDEPFKPRDLVTANDAVVRIARLERPETKQYGND